MTLAIAFSSVALACYVALVLVTFRQGGKKRPNQVFVLYLAAMAFWQFTALMVSLAHNATAALWWYRVMTAGIGGQFIFYLLFVLVFLGAERPQGLLYAGWFIFAALMVVSGTGLVIESVSVSEATGLHVPQFGPLVPVVGIGSYLFLGYGIYSLVRAYRSTRSSLQRNRIKYLLFGAGVIAVGSFSNLVPALRAYPIDVAANVANAFLITYAILRHQLLDVTVVVRKGLLYSVPTVIIGAGYFLVISLVTRLFTAFAGPQIFVLSLVVAVIAAVVFQPLRDRAQRWVDRLFFREKYDSSLMLQRLSSTTASVLDLGRLTDMILEEVITTVHLERAAFFLREETGGEFRLMAQKGLDSSAGLRLGNDHPIVEWFSVHNGVLTGLDIDMIPHFKALWGRERADLERLGAELLIPLKVKGRLVGIFAGGSKLSEEIYSQDDQLTLTTLANQTAMAIENARLYDEARRRAKEIAALNKTGQVIASTLDLDTVLGLAMTEARSVVDAEAASVLLHDPGTDTLVFAASVGPASERLIGRGMPATAGIAGWVVREGQPVLIRNAQSDARFYNQIDATTGMTTRSLLAVPLRYKDRIIGVIEAINRVGGLFDEHDLDLLSTWAGSAAVSIENARLYEEVSRQADELAAAVARLRELDHLKSEFIQNVSHELRTPLALMRGYAEVLDSGELGELRPEQQGPVSIIARRARMLTELVGDITLIMEAETDPPEPEPVHMDELIRAVVEDFQVAVEQAGLVLHTEIAPDPPPVYGSPTYLRRVVDNLVDNAVKFTPQGGTVTVRLRGENGRVALEVSDTGIGIPPDQHARIFDRFYQVDGSASRRYGGVGLGLALVKQIAEAYGGHVTVESQPGEGTTLAVILPAVTDGD
jgi:signal transduction histidine kinase